MELLIVISKFALNAIYTVFKCFKTKNKITFLSRQSNEISIDFRMLCDEIKRQDSTVKQVVLAKKIEKGILNKLKYAIHMVVQMYHVATSKVVVIDGYQIVVSVLKHKKQLKVVQIWHALGSLKKFGYSVIGKREGSKEEVAKRMNMHKNYDVVLSSSEFAKKNFAEAFNVELDKVRVMGLPRIDFLTSKVLKEETKTKILSIYPVLSNNKKNIVYVPTFRKNGQVDIKNIIDLVDYTKYNLIIKLHSGKEQIYIDNSENYIEGNAFTGMEFLHIADYVITDYSAISVEAAIAEKPLYFYVYDYNKYKKSRDMYIDFEKEMPGVISENANEIITGIEKEIVYGEKLKLFIEKFVSTKEKNNTKILAEFVLNLMK